jgi:cysteinyl-tRNA synthetase
LICGTPTSEVDRIMAQGFDGIYLDKCDVTDDLREHFKAVARQQPDLDGDMVRFVRQLSAYTKARKPGFAVIMQNAEHLLQRADLRTAIDAVAKEELIFGIDAPERQNGRDDFEDARKLLDIAKNDGKPVFVVEYLGNAAKIEQARTNALSLGYVLYVAPKDRELDRLAPPLPTAGA